MEFKDLVKYAKKYNIEYKNNIGKFITYHKLFNRVIQHKSIPKHINSKYDGLEHDELCNAICFYIGDNTK